MMNKIREIFIVFLCLGLYGCVTANNNQNTGEAFTTKQNPEFIWVEIISRPVARKNELIPAHTKRSRHLAIISHILPHGIWEMGPDDEGMIVTTNTVKDLSSWHTYIVTQKCIELGGDYIHSQLVEVNRKGLIDAIKLYETAFVGKEKYSYYSYNENYAVSSVIYGAGGPKLINIGATHNGVRTQ